jgi:hypothetical protein
VRHRGGGGRGVGGRGAGCRRTRHSPAGRHGEEEARALAGEATGGGGRGTRRWWGGVRRSKKWCSPVRGREAEEAGARCQAVRGRAARGWDARGQESRGRSGGMRSDGWHGRDGCSCRVGRLGARGSVGLLDRWVQVMDL